MYRSNAWLKYNQKEMKSVMKFAEGYKAFLSKSKTERLAVKESVALLEAAGFKNADQVKSAKAGDKLYWLTTGAYTSTYASVEFNGFPPIKTYYY